MERQYKDSGVEWIGKIPETWGTCKVSQLYNVQLGKMLQPNQITDTDTYENYLCAANVGQNALKFFPLRQMWIQKKERDIYSLSKGDLIVVEGGDVASCDIIKDNVYNLFFQNALHRVRAKKGYTVDYLRYVLMTAKAVGYIDLICNKATISHFTKEKFENLVIPISHISEQQRIADYLDEKCGEIDSLIALQEQMIEKLKAYKQSVITEAVTKGLDPNAKLVPSGIDWVGDMPERWAIGRFYFLNWIRARLGWRGLKAEEYTETGFPFLSAFNIINNRLDWSNINFINQERYDESPEIKLNIGDVLLVKDGAGIGKCARIDELPYGPATVNGSLAVITPNKELHYKFLYYYLQSNPFWHIINLLLVGMGVPHLTQTNMKSIYMPLPIVEEQQSIASYLDEKCSDIDRLIGLKQQKIELLKDYKKSVIFEAVTGKTIIE